MILPEMILKLMQESNGACIKPLKAACEFKCISCAKISIVAANLFCHMSNKHMKLKVFENMLAK